MPLGRPVSVKVVAAPGAEPTMVKAESQEKSFRRMRKLAAVSGVKGLWLMVRMAEFVLPVPDRDRESTTGGKLVLWLAASPASPQAMSCRAKAAKMAAPCGVPLARLPSSSSAVRRR